MKTEWDYTKLAQAYLKRPDYAQEAIDKMFSMAEVKPGDNACDVGAGAAHLTMKLAEYGLKVCAIEPNDAMRTMVFGERHNMRMLSGLRVLESILV